MKPAFYLALIFLCLSLLAISCSGEEPVPVACVQAEVVGADCETGWYVLRLLNDNQASGLQSNRFVGQIQGGLVTTDNLPAAYRLQGIRIEVALELNGEYSPRCVATSVMYPAVRVVQVCACGSGNCAEPEATVSRGNRLLSKLGRCLA
ncbi:hypothetical protein [Pontibacter beigongshangensis]|uniref:hypothetical protein n=1 Tax=Pontibacter beigongshangensis TaxID=2574733 RepID=UPI00164FC37D|nr:hypothetical protein [Pontibacter beigongshangensis]